MKKLLIFAAALTLLLSLAACKSEPASGAEKTAQAAENGTNAAENGTNAAAQDGDVFVISSAQDLVEYARISVEEPGMLRDAVLTADIDLSSVCGPEKGSWYPIGYGFNKDGNKQGNSYSKCFNGNGHTISGLYCAGLETGGLFYEISYGEVRDLVLSDCRVADGEDLRGVADYGILAGRVKGESVIRSVTVTDSCRAEATVASAVGGLIGAANYGGVRIEDCSNGADVSGYRRIGGICGEIEDGVVIQNCVNTGTITGAAFIGGIAGSAESASFHGDIPCRIIGCVNRGTVGAHYKEDTGGAHASGIVNYNSDGEVLFCVNTGEVVRLDDSGTVDYRFGRYLEPCSGNNLQIGEKGDRELDRTLVYAPGDAALTNGEALSALGEEYWTQGEEYPVWNGKVPS